MLAKALQLPIVYRLEGDKQVDCRSAFRGLYHDALLGHPTIIAFFESSSHPSPCSPDARYTAPVRPRPARRHYTLPADAGRSRTPAPGFPSRQLAADLCQFLAAQERVTRIRMVAVDHAIAGLPLGGRHVVDTIPSLGVLFPRFPRPRMRGQLPVGFYGTGRLGRHRRFSVQGEHVVARRRCCSIRPALAGAGRAVADLLNAVQPAA